MRKDSTVEWDVLPLNSRIGSMFSAKLRVTSLLGHLIYVYRTLGETWFLSSQLFQHTSSSGQFITGFTDTTIDDQFVNRDFTHAVIRIFSLESTTYVLLSI